MIHPTNRAAWLQDVKVYPLSIKPAPYTEPGADELVVRNAAIALNPADYMTQHQGKLMFPWIKYPFILGADLAGEVVQVGSSVTRFKPGDRVVAYAASTDPQRNRATEGAFQLYSVVTERMTAKMLDSMSFETAAVLPMAVTTAAAALFQKDHLGLRYPGVSLEMGDEAGKVEKDVVIVWGGSTSVGSNTIQLAIAAGYEVMATCSPRNFHHLMALGATQCFDYGSASAVAEMTAACLGRRLAGAVAIGHNSGLRCMDILAKCDGAGSNRFVSLVTYPMPAKPGANIVRMALTYMYGNAALFIRSWAAGCGYKFVFGSSIMHNEVSTAVWNDYFPGALEQKKHVPVPEPEVVGEGLESIQDGLELLKKGVSFKKLVVRLS